MADPSRLWPTLPPGARRDVLAGLSLASMNIPQLLGYARIAGMPLVTGLYTAVLPVALFALLGSSRHLVVAADSATAAVIAASVGEMARPATAQYVALAGTIALLASAMLLVGRVFKLGFIADFLSRTVLVGFLSGVGLQVSIMMVPGMLGLLTRSHTPLQQLVEIVHGLPETSGLSAALAAAVAVAVLAGHRAAPRWPVGLMVIVAAIAASRAFGLEHYGIAVIGPVAGGLPALAWPSVSWREALVLLPVAASCVVLVIAQSSATARSYALRHGEADDTNADLLGLAAANAGAGLTGTFVVNGSPTQTAMAEQAGAHSQLAQLTFAAVAVVVLVALTGVLQALPHCVLAAVVFTIAIRMVDWGGLQAIRRESPGEFALAVLTALTVVAIGVEQGLLLAVTLSLLRHVRHSYRPHTGLLARGPHDEWMMHPVPEGALAEPGIAVYRFGADLFYANEFRFCDELRALARRAAPGLHTIVVEASAIADLDYSAAQSLRALIDELGARRVRLVFGRVSDGLRADMVRHRIVEQVGVQHLHPSLHAAMADARGTAR